MTGPPRVVGLRVEEVPIVAAPVLLTGAAGSTEPERVPIN
jgi:hypothetical protein